MYLMNKQEENLFFAQKIRMRYPLVMQLLFVTLAFALMVVFSIIFVNKMLMSYLGREARYALTQTQLRIAAELREPETLMIAIVEEVRDIIMNGGSHEDVMDYYEKISPKLSNKTEGFEFAGIQSYVDRFEQGYIAFPAWNIPGDYDVSSRPWYVTAVNEGGNITASPMYQSMHSGEYQITYVCRIFDDFAKPLGVIGLNVPLFNISKFVVDTYIAEGGYGFLANNDFEIIAHPEEGFISMPMGEMSLGFSELSAMLGQGEDVFQHGSINYKDMESIFYCIQIDNGWYLGIVTPRDEYYRDYANLLIFLSALGFVLMVAVYVTLIRFDLAKQKAHSEMKRILVETERLRQVEKSANQSKSVFLEKMRETLLETEQLRREAEAANKSKSIFLASMSHEIRTPMNVILGITEIQLQNEGSQAEREEALLKIYDAGNLLLSIINDILDLSKIEAGKLEIIPAKYNIASLLNDTVQLNIMRYGGKPIDFFLDIDENTPLNLHGDELRVKQILGNILSNAFKYTDKGEIKISVWAEYTNEPPPVSDVTLIFQVSDTGQGMTAEQLSLLYKDYTRFNLKVNRTTVGTGLGMSITKRLVDLMGGTIVVESEENKGSMFTVRIPQKCTDSLVCGSDMAEKLKNFRYLSTSMLKRNQISRDYMPYGKVLIVDDVESNIYVAKGMLLPYGLKIETASSGYEAIENVKNGKVYDIIFMDHLMPKMDGIETTKNLRNMGYTQIIVALTANALVGQAETFLKNGFNDYLSKPIDLRDLGDILNRYIRDKKQTEIVMAMHKEAEAEKHSEGMESFVSKELLEAFLWDAENAVSMLNELFTRKETFGEADIDSYKLIVHGIKSALANIGETELSEYAYKLEQAGNDQELTIIINETQGLIDALELKIEKLKCKTINERR